ncbi:MAG: Gx transporter family protein [Oscillospiraceae bacterium]|jgi:heptaprenyl diphosphate synthase|nr:Gx transporter family protein [Oscillospiraceae bacterium]
MNARKLVMLALFTAVSLCLFVIEAQIPPLTPFPGIKTGLANIVTLFILYRKDARLKFSGMDVSAVVAARVLLSAFVTGGAFVLLFSFTGGMAAVAAMLLFRRIFKGGLIPVAGVAGAVTHNAGQLATAVFVYKSVSVLLYLPILVLGGIASGLFTGFTVKVVLNRLDKTKGG